MADPPEGRSLHLVYLGTIASAAGVLALGGLLGTGGGGPWAWVGFYAAVVCFAVCGFLAIRWAR